MSYISLNENDRKVMCEMVGIKEAADLYSHLPGKGRVEKLNLPAPLAESEILKELSDMSAKNSSADQFSLFLGGGIYNHFVPQAVEALSSRGEFLTSYTPYQPEVSQGTLQAIFEYQTMIAELFGMATVNGSHYDGGTALAEAVLIAIREKRGSKNVALAPYLNPQYRAVIETYLQGQQGITVQEAPDSESACYVAQFPAFDGSLTDLKSEAEKAKSAGALYIVHGDPIAFALFKPAGEFGADIATGEGQCLGNGMNFGGPCLGIIAVSEKLTRKIPGRLVGAAFDSHGEEGCVLTLSAREQHIRREKATSNICSNQGLAALRAAIYLSLLGKGGVRKVAELCWNRANYLADELEKIEGFSILSKRPFFREFIVKTPVPGEDVVKAMAKEKIIAGYPLVRVFPDRPNEILVSVTEMNSRHDIDRYIEKIGAYYG